MLTRTRRAGSTGMGKWSSCSRMRTSPWPWGGPAPYWFRVVMTRRPGRAPLPGFPGGTVRDVAALGGLPWPSTPSARPETLGRSNGLPGQSFQPPPRAGAITPGGREHPDRSATVARNWLEVEDFTGSLPGDHHYVLHGSTGMVHFGPPSVMQTGLAPARGDPPAEAEITMLPTVTAAVRGQPGVRDLDEPSLHGGIHRSGDQYRPRQGWGGLRDGEQSEKTCPVHPSHAATGGHAPRLRAIGHRSLNRGRQGTLPRPSDSRRTHPFADSAQAPAGPESQTLDDFALTDGLVARITDYLEPRRMLGTTSRSPPPTTRASPWRAISVQCRLPVTIP